MYNYYKTIFGSLMISFFFFKWLFGGKLHLKVQGEIRYFNNQ